GELLPGHPVTSPPPTPAAAAGAGRASDLVGRDDELDLLTERWATAVGGKPGVLVLAGAAGTGKTRVPAELARLARTSGAAGVLGRDAEVVVLRPLSVAAVDRLARHLGVTDVSSVELHARTGGNPQFVVEALRLAAEGPGAVHPESLQVAVLERVRRAGRDVE